MISGFTYRETYKLGLIRGPFDEMPFLFKDFKKQGYITSFHEDNSFYSMFNYIKKGFKKQPADVYARPFWSHFDRQFHNQICAGRVSKFDVWLSHLNGFLKRASLTGVPTFSFAHYIAATHHSFFTSFARADLYVEDFIKTNYNYLKNSIFIFMGDHGLRSGKAVATNIGTVDMNMPAFEMHIPQNLHNLYPHLQKFLMLNSVKITSWLDVHQMLVDVSKGELILIFHAVNRFTVKTSELEHTSY